MNKFLSLTLFVVASQFIHPVFASAQAGDEKKPLSNIPAIGRVRADLANDGAGACTLTMIGRSCALSVRHCAEAFKHAEFNVPLSDSGGRMTSATAPDIYPILEFWTEKSYRIEDDVAVLKLGKNAVSQKYPGDDQGYLMVDDESVLQIGNPVQRTGFPGRKGPFNQVQKTVSGFIKGGIL